ncbi:MAG: metal-sulfur cluster assembly factor [Gemmatimonadales bacterium]|jgi:metal-sulfur cluster biosynthetic enzyme
MTLVQLGRAPSEPDTSSGSASIEDGMDFSAVLAETMGEGRVLPPPPEWSEPPADLAERARRALYEVSDPEFAISLADLGLIYGVSADETTGVVRVQLTFTATACPCTDFIKWDVRDRLLREPGIDRVDVEVVWDPPWTTARISERGRRILEDAGIALIT